MNYSSLRILAFAALGIAFAPACGSSTSPDAGRCTPGQSVACVGAGGCPGGQTCEADGQSYGACECGATSGASTTGATSTATTTGGSSSGTGGGSNGGSAGSTGGQACGPGGTWMGDICVVPTCSAALNRASCMLGDGGIGACLGSSCIDVESDSANCGAPGMKCADGLSCAGGQCLGDGGCSGPAGCPIGSTCYLGRTCLSPTCNAERSGLLCANSNAVSSDVGFCCGTDCTDLDDPQNCGACGAACEPGKFCAFELVSSAYVLTCTDCAGSPDNTPCPMGDGGICCGGTCQPVANADPLNCGYCGIECPGGAAGTCTAGVCSGDCSTCPAGTQCVGEGTSLSCLAMSCVAGTAGRYCLTDQGGSDGCCGGTTCMRLDNDPNNCGGCGIVCGPGELCQNDSCVLIPVLPASCATESEGAPCTLGPGAQGICCSGTCADTTSDATNCGSCGSVCPSTGTCQDSSCNPRVCQTSDDCPSNDPCVANLCAPSCAGRADGEQCAAAQADGGVRDGTCCSGACAAIANDPGNCGGCGLLCPAGFACDSATCHQGASNFVCGAPGVVTCPDGAMCAGAPACTPLSCTGRQNGDACAFGPNLAGACCGGECMNLISDPANCGGCGLACPASGYCGGGACVSNPVSPPCDPACGSDAICAQGACVTSLCDGASDCLARDGLAGVCCGGGACVDLLNDSSNCGDCGWACPAGEACAAGVCQGDACTYLTSGAYCSTPGLPDACCENACVDVETDPANCGTCGNLCSSGTCRAGACT